MARGGYQIIDFKKRHVKTSFKSGFMDIFDVIKNTNKMLLVHNLVIEDEDGASEEIRDFLCTPKELADGFILVCLELNIIIQVDAVYGIARWYPYYGDGIKFYDNGVLTLNVNDTLDCDDDGKLGVDVTELPINSTLEVDSDGKLGVAGT